MAMTKADLTLFVAYAHEDRPVVLRLVAAIRSRGWRVYWDEELPAGQYGWQQMLEKELSGAFGVLVIWSQHSVTSAPVRAEAAAAHARQRAYGVSIDGVAIPPEFADRWSVDLRGWDGDADDPRLASILSWPDALSLFHTGLPYPVAAPPRAQFKPRPGPAKPEQS